MSRAPAIACQLSTPARDFARQASIPVQALSTFFIVRVCAHHIFTLASVCAGLPYFFGSHVDGNALTEGFTASKHPWTKLLNPTP